VCRQDDGVPRYPELTLSTSREKPLTALAMASTAREKTYFLSAIRFAQIKSGELFKARRFLIF
jgi:hypothetical protein